MSAGLVAILVDVLLVLFGLVVAVLAVGGWTGWARLNASGRLVFGSDPSLTAVLRWLARRRRGVGAVSAGS